jgi:hypothetical protein
MKAREQSDQNHVEAHSKGLATGGSPSPLTGLDVRPEREQVSVTAEARLFQQPQLTVVVKNVSVGGFCAEHCTTFPIGSQMILDVDGIGQLPAVIRWSLDGNFGARFNGRLSNKEKDMIVALVRSNRKA